jgi:hypothetical protein
MLDLTLKFLAAELNTYLLARTGSDFGQAEVGRLVDDTGKWATKEDHIGLALLSLEEERAAKGQVPEGTFLNGRYVTLEPALRLNLYLVVAAHFKQYDVGLRYLSFVLTFFQSRPLFTPDRYPGLDRRIERLAVDLFSPGFDQLNQIWTFIGGKQLPSAIYRLRLVALQDVEPAGVGPPILEIETELGMR